ncbi:DUF4974 domain-containing protein [Olivibacter ginsenosidimutans]|uniref:DUF4974 domain-containing protein n=1 Tax=Olivibacter ginsenosidimutans TaxID=1176537 RepID=A0ABP9AFT5_9SPHI
MNERLNDLYQRYLENACSEEELQELRSFVTNPAYERELAALLDETWDNLNATEASTESTKDMHLLYRRIVTTPQRKQLRRKWWPYMAAASIACLLVIAGFYVYFLGVHSSQPVAVRQQLVNDVAPGGSKATLKLADGSTIDIERVEDGRVKSKSGLEVVKQQGQLIFSPSITGEADTGYNQIMTPNGGQYQVKLPDGTQVWLNAASSLRFPAVFSGSERKVELTGEAYFEVAKNKDQPFRVNVNQTSTIEVLGTHFNVMAYPNEHTINTTLLEGSIKVSHGKRSSFVSPGQQVRIDKTGIQVVNADLEEAVAWKNGLFQFSSTDLRTIMHQMERWYNVEVHYTSDVSNKKLTGLISRNTNLSNVLRMLELAGSVHFQIDGTKIMVSP